MTDVAAIGVYRRCCHRAQQIRTLAITQSPPKNYDSNSRSTGDLRASLCSSKPLRSGGAWRSVC